MKWVNQINTVGGQIKVEILNLNLGNWDSGSGSGFPYVKGTVLFRSKNVGTFETFNDEIRVMGPIIQMLKSGMFTADRNDGFQMGTDLIQNLVCDLLVDLV